jgi:hypothetical protein
LDLYDLHAKPPLNLRDLRLGPTASRLEVKCDYRLAILVDDSVDTKRVAGATPNQIPRSVPEFFQR